MGFSELVREREREIIFRTMARLETYAIKVLHSDGLYRDLYCFQPGNPYGEGERSFHVYTRPGGIAVHGDWCSEYVLERVPDMLTGFFGPRPNMGYWAEKLTVRVPVRVSEYGLTKQWLIDFLTEYADEHDMTPSEARELIDEALMLDLEENVYSQLFDFEPWIGDELISPFGYDELDGCGWEVWSDEWIRVCCFLAWVSTKWASGILEPDHPLSTEGVAL